MIAKPGGFVLRLYKVTDIGGNVTFSISYDRAGNATWEIRRKAYRKARWKKCGQRWLDRERNRNPEGDGIIILVL